jgi:hypothetical protein
MGRHVQKHLMVFDLGQATDDPNQDRIIRNAKLVTKVSAPRCVPTKEAKIQTQWNHLNLVRAPNAKGLANLDTLLSAYDYQLVSNKSGQCSFDREK